MRQMYAIGLHGELLTFVTEVEKKGKFSTRQRFYSYSRRCGKVVRFWNRIIIVASVEC